MPTDAARLRARLALVVSILLSASAAGAHGVRIDVDHADQREMEAVRRKVVTQGSVCPDPDHPCEGFKPNELSFRIAKAFTFDRGQDRSAPFYAVLLKTAPLCTITEQDRLDAQASFPREKCSCTSTSARTSATR